MSKKKEVQGPRFKVQGQDKTADCGPRTAGQFHAVILAGGRGTRFWPRSRRSRAKQVLSVVSEQTLIQQTLGRTVELAPPERTWVITNDYLRDEIARQLPGVPPDHIIAEPAQRNTAPAIGLAAHLVARCAGRESILGVFPADHVISREAAFRRVLRTAIQGAVQGNIVVLGIKPRWPETGYGYIEFARRPDADASRSPRIEPVAGFTEKPDLATARRYLRTGRYYWNSGMFVWSAATYLDALARFLPHTAAVLDEIGRNFSTETLARLYPQCENISVDYAVMEKAASEARVTRNPPRRTAVFGPPQRISNERVPPGVVGVPADIGWNDVGSWNAVYELLPRDKEGNAVRGDAWLLDAHGNYLDVTSSPGKLIAAIGVDDLVVVDSPDALLIVRRDRAQDVSKVVKWLEKVNRNELL